MLVLVLAGGGGSSHLMGGNGAASAREVLGGSTISVSSSIDKCQGNGNLCLNNELKIPGAHGLVIGRVGGICDSASLMEC